MKKLSIITLILLSILNCTTPIPSLLVNVTEEHVYGISNGNTLGPARVEVQGESCTTSVFLLSIFFNFPGRSIDKAIAEGKIGRIASIDYRSVSVFPFLEYLNFYNMECVVVTGEKATSAPSTPATTEPVTPAKTPAKKGK
jgi:hypothetical protein